MTASSAPFDHAIAPSLDDFARLAAAAFEALPSPFRELAAEASIRIEDFAEAAVLDELGIEDAFDLTGLYSGVDLSRRSTMDFGGQLSPMIFLYRRPILDEWSDRGDVTLADLITHVLVHEIGHHFGLSDDDIDRIEAEQD